MFQVAKLNIIWLYSSAVKRHRFQQKIVPDEYTQERERSEACPMTVMRPLALKNGRKARLASTVY